MSMEGDAVAAWLFAIVTIVVIVTLWMLSGA